VKTFWEDPSRLGEVLTLVKQNPETFRAVITSDFAQANVLVRTRFETSTEIAAAVNRIRDWAEQHPGMPAEPTGNIILLNGTTDDVVWGQVKSVTVALAVIFVVMSLLFLSAKVGFIAGFAENGGIFAVAPGRKNTVTIAFAADTKGAGPTEKAFRAHASAFYKRHISDIMQSKRNAVLVWTTAPTQDQINTAIACLAS